ncbi:MAG: GNAT family N-acetyltransferase [Chitinophaga sp.]|uniref:GNAT family N-acetyltransferase n=1 Tax=Chitinophaga sp. TaxID=1869181 RepID=UPI001AFF6611|nr:GNAT family N-acetyltransferase [Chitinophaga sp.]MBO9729338.1 GNAT family N-acetyltransferase [Chitinophaga sp.]
MTAPIDIIKTNLDNLTSLWKTVGIPFNGFVETPIYNYCKVPGSDWPNRLWFKQDVTPETLTAALAALPTGKMTIPYWDIYGTNADEYIIARGGVKSSEQAGMSLKLGRPFTGAQHLRYELVRSHEQADAWAAIYPQSFGYQISGEILKKTYQDIRFYLAYLGDQLVGTAILHCVDGIAGIHGVGVIPEMRKKGFANEIMEHVLNESIELNAAYATLQASKMGIGIYLKMGFADQFLIKNYAFITA